MRAATSMSSVDQSSTSPVQQMVAIQASQGPCLCRQAHSPPPTCTHARARASRSLDIRVPPEPMTSLPWERLVCNEYVLCSAVLRTCDCSIFAGLALVPEKVIEPRYSSRAPLEAGLEASLYTSNGR